VVRIETEMKNYIGIEEISECLGSIIKKDEIAKVVSFLTQFSAYLLDDQLNLIIASLSSTGKTYVLLNVAHLFPSEDVIVLGYSSPKAFFHELGIFDREKRKIYINLERKNLIFLDQPHPELLAKLRPILSHDQKEIEVKITDKNQRGGNLTKSVIIRGFPAVSFATTYLKLDEQEITRALIISPEVTQEKVEEGIDLIAESKTNEEFKKVIRDDPGLNLLKERLLKFKEISPRLKGIKFDIEKDELKKAYMENKNLAPKDMRNFKKFLVLAECFAGLNFENDRVQNNILIVKKEDIEEAKKLWQEIGKYQDVGVMPFALDVYYKVILPLYKEGNVLTKKVIMKGLQSRFYTSIQLWYLEQQVLPALETSGYISIEKNPQDKRQIIVIPLIDADGQDKNNENEEISNLLYN